MSKINRPWPKSNQLYRWIHQIRNAIFLNKKLALKNYVNPSVFRFWSFFFLPSSVFRFFPVNTMHIQHGKKFIEIIARNTPESQKGYFIVIQPYVWCVHIIRIVMLNGIFSSHMIASVPVNIMLKDTSDINPNHNKTQQSVNNAHIHWKVIKISGSLLLTWLNFNPSRDKFTCLVKCGMKLLIHS